MKKLFVMMLAVSLVACAWGAPVSAATVFSDNFELVDFSAPPTEPNVNDELPGSRQSGAVGSTYTAAGNVFLHDNSAPNGTDALVLRTIATDTAAAGVAVDLDQDFGPSLAGKKYSVTYEGQVDHSPAPGGDNWQAFGIGDTPADGPNGGSADFGILFRLNGDWSVWLDGVPAVNSGINDLGINTGIGPSSPYSITFDFDETIAAPTVTASVNASLGNVILGTLPLNAVGTGFESASRFIELRGHQGPSANPAGEIIDIKLDNLTITVVPEPASLLLLTLSGISCLSVRRRQ